jgi:nicotinamidase/pyrazinamidase
MDSVKPIFWEVDAQRDFLLPGGALYVPGAEAILPNLRRLAAPARQGRIFLVSSADAHNPDDAEFRQWPPHCLKGTSGAEIVADGLAPQRLIIPNRADFELPENFHEYQQVTLEKNTLDVFDNPQTEQVLEMLARPSAGLTETPIEFVVFGVVTEYCVRCTVEGLLRRNRKVALVEDAIKSLDESKGKELLDGWRSRSVRFLSTAQAASLAATAQSAR